MKTHWKNKTLAVCYHQHKVKLVFFEYQKKKCSVLNRVLRGIFFL